LPENVFLVDKVQGKITSLGALIEEGLFDPMDGTYINPNTGEKLSLADAKTCSTPSNQSEFSFTSNRALTTSSSDASFTHPDLGSSFTFEFSVKIPTQEKN
jgi:hypothetical protein